MYGAVRKIGAEQQEAIDQRRPIEAVWYTQEE
jgi:hypothetical protein